ncbi:flagellar filament capping protein FliD [Aidingimonas lacisalsi]|uniref:flagellar filament capping protein FliD n=1 Tax=Aidingimonas lacisalsi TaxID=2604086 RepID=UPI0011D2AB06|nr:flagellar filament capping protein FliD [Aidingimonas lacisalsi]
MATIQSLGVGSGLDLNGLLDQLRSAEEEKLQPIENQQASYDAKISAYGELDSALSKFQSSLSTLNEPETFQSVTSEATGSAIDVAADSDAVPGEYGVSVTQLAQASSIATTRVDDTAAEQGAGTVDITLADGTTTSVDITQEDSSLESIRDAINDSESGVSASVINDGTGYRLALSSVESGTEAAIDSVTFTGDLGASGLATDAATEQTAQNAQLSVNGVAIESQSNTVEGALQGVTLDLNETGDSRVTVEQDTGAIKDAVTSFVDDYNALQDTMADLTAFDSESGEAAELMGDSTLRGIQSQLRSALGEGVEGDDGQLTLLSDVGISLEVDGRLSIDEETLDDVVATDQGTLVDFFAGSDAEGGLAGMLDAQLEAVTGTDGSLETAVEGLNTRTDGLDDRYESVQRNIDNTMARYQEQFSQMDSMVAEMNSMSSYLSQQLGGGSGGMSSLM